MASTEYAGIDYSLGQANVDKETGIRFGVIPMHALSEFAHESFEADYGEPHCPKCGNEAFDSSADYPEGEDYCLACNHNHGKAWGGHGEPHKDAHCHDCDCKEPDWKADHDADDLEYETERGACGDYRCDDCKYLFDGDEAFGDDPCGHVLNEQGYEGWEDSTGDVMLTKSPYYTHAQFCSPCAPGAGYLLNPCKSGPKTYCFGHDWFDDDKAPYPVYSVKTGKRVPAPKK